MLVINCTLPKAQEKSAANSYTQQAKKELTLPKAKCLCEKQKHTLVVLQVGIQQQGIHRQLVFAHNDPLEFAVRPTQEVHSVHG